MNITKEQYEELCESKFWDGTEAFHELLESITGIEAKRYTGYQYFDASGNYLGDISECTVKDLLDNAYIQINE
jgi:hypothetical protein